MGRLPILAGTGQENSEKINAILNDIARNGASKGIGKPEPLKYRKGWSRRIDDKNRIVYEVDENGNVLISTCRTHYGQ